MKRLVLSVVVGLGLANAADIQFCKLEKKVKNVKVVDNFGNVKTIKSNELKELLYNLSTKPITKEKKEKMMLYWGEILSKNRKFLKRLLTNDIVNFAAQSGIYETVIRAGIRQGSLPGQLNINISNLQTKKGNIKATIDIYSLAGGLWSYTALTKDWDLFRDRILLLNAFLVAKGYPNLPESCGWGLSGIVSHTLYKLIQLVIKKHDKDAIRVAFLLANNKLDKLDEFLLSKKEVKELFQIGRKHYLELTNAK